MRKVCQNIAAQQATRKLVAGGHGCTPDLAVRINQAIGVSAVMYVLPLAKLTDANWKKLELDHNASLRMCLGLLKFSNVAATLAEAGVWPLKIQALRAGLNIVARLKLAPDSETQTRPRRGAAETLPNSATETLVSSTPANNIRGACGHRTGPLPAAPATSPRSARRYKNNNRRHPQQARRSRVRATTRGGRHAARTLRQPCAPVHRRLGAARAPPRFSAAACVVP